MELFFTHIALADEVTSRGVEIPTQIADISVPNQTSCFLSWVESGED